LNVLMDGASLTDSGVLGDEWQKVCWPIVRLARGIELVASFNGSGVHSWWSAQDQA